MASEGAAGAAYGPGRTRRAGHPEMLTLCVWLTATTGMWGGAALPIGPGPKAGGRGRGADAPRPHALGTLSICVFLFFFFEHTSGGLKRVLFLRQLRSC